MSASTVYGPVRSWRYGNSLGIDVILSHSACTFNCVYCQLGTIEEVTAKRRVFVETDKLIDDFDRTLLDDIDIITFSGSGEPTLALNIGEIIEYIKDKTGIPVLILTNGTLLHNKEVRQALVLADEVSVKLDGINDETIRQINRPADSILYNVIWEGIGQFKEEYRGTLSIQTMLMPMSEKWIDDLTEKIIQVHPARVDLNTPKRPYPSKWSLEYRGAHNKKFPESKQLNKVSKETLNAIKARLEGVGIKTTSVEI